jgi:hypothetical protein
VASGNLSRHLVPPKDTKRGKNVESVRRDTFFTLFSFLHKPARRPEGILEWPRVYKWDDVMMESGRSGFGP